MHQLLIQFDVSPEVDFNAPAQAVTNHLERLGYLIELNLGDDYTWVGQVEVEDADPGWLRDKIEALLSNLGGVSYHNVLIFEVFDEAPTVEPLGPRSRPSALAERALA